MIVPAIVIVIEAGTEIGEVVSVILVAAVKEVAKNSARTMARRKSLSEREKKEETMWGRTRWEKEHAAASSQRYVAAFQGLIHDQHHPRCRLHHRHHHCYVLLLLLPRCCCRCYCHHHFHSLVFLN